jgi:hypothetical protein
VEQTRCQGGFGHSWDDTFPPIGHERNPEHLAEVHLRCTRCFSRVLLWVDYTGHRGRSNYKRTPAWVTHARGEAPTSAEKTMAMIATLDPEHVVRNGKAPRTNRRTKR